MISNDKNSQKNAQRFVFPFVSLLALLLVLVACGRPSAEDLAAVDYTPLPRVDWEISSPEAEGLDPDMVAKLYYDADKLDSIYSLLIVKNGKLMAENYFNDGSIDLKSNVQSVTKSYVSALVGLAFEQGCLTSLDQPFLDFFPEYADRIEDPRKEEITIRHLLQMRSGYPWEESHDDLWEGMLAGDFLEMMVQYPLITDPGTKFHYSNVSSYYLGAIVARACDVDLREFAEEQLFTPLGAELGEWWPPEKNEYPMGFCCIHVTARDAAKFALLYLNDGVFDGKQIISSEWIRDSLQPYSTGEQLEYVPRTGSNFKRTGYGYQWWGLQSGDYEYDAMLGHGGQTIALVDELDMVIVAIGDPFWLEDGWKYEKQIKNLVANFIASSPSE
jgi:CubicO group peptidase (beta-lactamase class C family)